MRTVVIGGGIAGLAAAWQLAAEGAGEVVVLEGSPQVGGKLLGHDVAGLRVDVGAEAMLNRKPEGVDLATALGLPVVHPTHASSRIWVADALRPLPRSLMGVPLDLEDLARSAVLSEHGLAAAARELDLPAEDLEGDMSVGDLVSRRFGAEVTDKLVEPLLGGVYAGHAREISALAAVPQLVTYARRGSVLAQAAGIPTTYDGPVFAGIPGGMSRLPEALVASGTFGVRTGATVRELRRTSNGFALVLGSTRDAEELTADRVVLATPAPAAARLLADVAPIASGELARIESASMAVVTMAFGAESLGALARTTFSGFLVPPIERRRIKAATFSFAKWGWVREAGAQDDLLVLRTSLGRHREEASLQLSDEELVAISLGDLELATGVAARPVDAHVQRWGGGLPQYAVGHLDRVSRIRADVDRVPGLAVCGAPYDGVGIPAVIASARRAVAQITGAEWGA
ncbi:MAG: protoporphyrinogen oxidase [Nocardioides sp.]|uniref:protoporphyrinogen oxidase n=1 Tax=Nocardioides sp. TaxID=35761 RepID=UPI003D0C641A